MLKSELRKVSLTPPLLETTSHLIAWDAAALEASTPFEFQLLTTELGSITIDNAQRKISKQNGWNGSSNFRMRGILPRSVQRWIIATPTLEAAADAAQTQPSVELHIVTADPQEPLLTIRFETTQVVVLNHITNAVKTLSPGGVMLLINPSTNLFKLYRSTELYSALLTTAGQGLAGATVLGTVTGGTGSTASLQFSSGIRQPGYAELSGGVSPLMFIESRLPAGATAGQELLASSNSYIRGVKIRKGERYRALVPGVEPILNYKRTPRTDKLARFEAPVMVQNGQLQFTATNIFLEPERQTPIDTALVNAVTSIGRGLGSIVNATRVVVLGAALPLVTRLNRVVAIGTLADRALEAYNSVLIGENTANRALAISGSTVVGDGAGTQSTQRLDQSTAIGYRALGALQGEQQLLRSTVAVGSYSLYGAVTGDRNTAVGALTGYSDGTSILQDSTMLGYRALGYRTGSSYKTVALGASAGYGMIGEGVVALGYHAGLEPQGYQTNSIYIGREAGMYAAPYLNAGAIGYRATVTASQHIQLGNPDQWIVTNNGYQTRMDARDMAEVRPTVFGLDFIKRLNPIDYRNDARERYIDYSDRPVPPLPPTVGPDDPLYPQQFATYTAQLTNYTSDIRRWLTRNSLNDLVANGANVQGIHRTGFKAQEVITAALQSGHQFGGVVNHADFGGQNVLTLSMADFIPPMVKAIQELASMVSGDQLVEDVADRVITILNDSQNSPLVDAIAQRVLQQLLQRR